MNTKAKKTIKIIVNTLLWIFLVFALTMTVIAFIANSSGKDYPVIGDNVFLCVQSDSMDGDSSLYDGKDWEINKGFKKGDLIICKSFEDDNEKRHLNVGDVITFYQDLDGDGNNEINTHRIIGIDNSSLVDVRYITKGDNVEYADNDSHSAHPYTVPASRIEAKWTGKRIGGLGSFIDFFRSSVGFLCCVVIPLALFFIYEVVVLILTVKKMKGNKAPVISKEDEEEIKKRAIEEYLQKQALQNNQGDNAQQ